MARLQDLGKRRDIVLLHPSKVVVAPGFNARDFTRPEVQQHVQSLAASIRENGVLAPLTVYMDGDQPILTDGECRLRASLLAIEGGWDCGDGIPCQLDAKPAATNEAERALSLLTRNSALPLAPVEQAEVYRRLEAAGWPVEKMASRTGRSGEHVRNMLALAAAPVAVQQAIKVGEISASAAATIVRKEGAKAAEIVTQAVETAKAAGKAKVTPKDLKPPKPPKVALVAWRDRVDLALKLIEQYDSGKGGGPASTLRKVQKVLEGEEV